MSHQSRNVEPILWPTFPWIQIMLMFPSLDLTGISSKWQSSTRRFTPKSLSTTKTLSSKLMAETLVQKRHSFKKTFLIFEIIIQVHHFTLLFTPFFTVLLFPHPIALSQIPGFYFFHCCSISVSVTFSFHELISKWITVTLSTTPLLSAGCPQRCHFFLRWN